MSTYVGCFQSQELGSSPVTRQVRLSGVQSPGRVSRRDTEIRPLPVRPSFDPSDKSTQHVFKHSAAQRSAIGVLYREGIWCWSPRITHPNFYEKSTGTDIVRDVRWKSLERVLLLRVLSL